MNLIDLDGRQTFRMARVMAELHQLRCATLDLVAQVQDELLSQDAILASFDLSRLERVIELLRPDRHPTGPRPLAGSGERSELEPDQRPK